MLAGVCMALKEDMEVTGKLNKLVRAYFKGLVYIRLDGSILDSAADDI